MCAPLKDSTTKSKAAQAIDGPRKQSGKARRLERADVGGAEARRVAPGLRCVDGTRDMMSAPINIQVIGNEVAIAWDDGGESYFDFERLRAASPSAANQGERDILGNQYGGDGPKKFPGVRVIGWEKVGNYAIRFDFSDGHNSGLYSYEYLRNMK